mmetsp:Transcript_53876/g.101195  ORF Transcript_53876/g.101195 Transcript_53876/m.101195 type:complete len:98 (-) Transcript_53876:125-418(-)
MGSLWIFQKHFVKVLSATKTCTGIRSRRRLFASWPLLRISAKKDFPDQFSVWFRYKDWHTRLRIGSASIKKPSKCRHIESDRPEHDHNGEDEGSTTI